MKIEVKADGFFIDEELSHFTRCCAGYELGTQRSQVEAVEVRLSGVNEARDGKDKSCFVKVDLSGRRKVITEVMDSDLHVAIHLALERASWSVARRLQLEQRQASNITIIERHVADLSAPDRAA